MPSAYEKQLREKAEPFLAALKSAGHNATIDAASLRDYSLALKIGSTIATIYYSPKRKEYSLTIGGDISLSNDLKAIWDAPNFSVSRSSVIAPVGTKYEPQLRGKAVEFIMALRDAALSAEIVEDSLAEYSLDIKIGKIRGTIWYSPKRGFYTLRLENNSEGLLAAIETVWNRMSAERAKPLVLKQAKSQYQAFVDGSFNSQKNLVGYGAIILYNGEEIKRISGHINKYHKSHQIGGELAATMEVVEWAKAQNLQEIDIFYDYTGIEKWSRGVADTSTEMAQSYAKFMKESSIKVHWHKVDSHTGDYWNEIADELAKQGALK